MYQDLTARLDGRENVRFLPRFRCNWGGFGIVRATLEGLRFAVDQGLAFDYLALLSGQDYPIKTNEYVRDFLARREGISFIQHEPFPFAAWEAHGCGWDRVRYWHIRVLDRHLIFPRERASFRFRPLTPLWNLLVRLFPAERRFPKGLHPFGGAQFWCLHRRHVLQVYDFIGGNPAFVRFFRFVDVPDEIFFQTVIGNSVPESELHNDTLTHVPWNRPGATLVGTDFSAIRSSPHLFARKFDPTIDPEVIDRIDYELLDPDMSLLP